MTSGNRIEFLDSSVADQSLRPSLRLELLLTSLVLHMLALALPLALLQIYDRILPNQSTGTVAFLVLGVGVAILLEAFLRYGRSRVLAAVGARFEAQAPVVMMRRLLSADLSEIDRRGAASLLHAFRSLGTVRDFWSGNAAVSLYETPFVLVYLVLIYYIGGALALVPLAVVAIGLLLALVVRRNVRRDAAAMEVADRDRQNFLWTVFDGLALAKAIGAERVLGARHAALSAASMARAGHFEASGALLRESSAALSQLSTVLVVSWGAVLVTGGELTTGGLAACSILAGRSIGPALGGLGYLVRIGQVAEAERRVRDVLTLPAVATAAAQPDAGRTEPGADVLEIDLDDGRTIRVEPGRIVGLDSARPDRASEVLAAAAGLRRDPSAGARLGGTPVLSLAPEELRCRVAYVPERSVLLPGSVLNNLTLYDPRCNEAARRLSDRFGLADSLGRLRHGILTTVGGPGGPRFDEGLVQRIALVRALVRGPAILILDQADNALDLAGEQRLAEFLQAERATMGVLLFSARPTVRAVCDRIEQV